jgi:hypothetical protein
MLAIEPGQTEVVAVIGFASRADVIADLKPVTVADHDCLRQMALVDEPEAGSTLECSDFGLELGAQRCVGHGLE